MAGETHFEIYHNEEDAKWRWRLRAGNGELETVAAYLAERADGGLSPASLGMDRAAIRYHHTEAGLANPFLPRPARPSRGDALLPGRTR